MPKISDARRAERRQEILDAALRCFLRNGYQKTSMAEIIAESGLSAGAIYGYFDGKADIIRGVAADVIGARRTELAEAAASHALSPAEIATVVITGVRSHAPLQALVQVWSEATVDDELHTMLDETLRGIRTTVTQAIEPWAAAHPDRIPTGMTPHDWAALVAPVIMSAVPGFALQRTIFDDFDEDAYVRALPAILPS